MTIKPLICAVLIAASPVLASTNLPPGAPLTIPAPTGQTTRDPTGLIFGVLIVQFSTCVGLYVYSKTVPYAYENHVWILQRRSPSYNSGQWENLSQKICPLTEPDRAYFMFSDRIDRDTGGGASFCQYRVVDMGPWYP